MSSSSVVVEKGFIDSIGKIELNPFLKAEVYTLIVSWNVWWRKRSMNSCKL
jgi:hypothetical protein